MTIGCGWVLERALSGQAVHRRRAHESGAITARASAGGPVPSTPASVLVIVGHLEEALVEAVIFEDLSMAASLSSDLGLLRHVDTVPVVAYPSCVLPTLP
jgi:hypothetical protein